jgi:hypothetical protein
LESVIAKWGDEIFFDVKEIQPAEGIRTSQVNVGDVAFCPDGNFLCVFFGPTPASVVEAPVPENPVVVIGKVLSSTDKLKVIKGGEKVKVAVLEKPTPSPEKNAFVSERKLSQAEIDTLVKQLLEERKRSHQNPS